MQQWYNIVLPMPMERINVFHEKYYFENCSCALKKKDYAVQVAVGRITCTLLDVEVGQVVTITEFLREAASLSTDENQHYLLPFINNFKGL